MMTNTKLPADIKHPIPVSTRPPTKPPCCTIVLIAAMKSVTPVCCAQSCLIIKTWINPTLIPTQNLINLLKL